MKSWILVLKLAVQKITDKLIKIYNQNIIQQAKKLNYFKVLR